jgi:hypothetical protein
VLSQTRPKPWSRRRYRAPITSKKETIMTTNPPPYGPYEQQPWQQPQPPAESIPPAAAPGPAGEYGAPVYAVPTPPAKPRRTSKVVLSILGGAFALSLLICLIGALASGGDDNTDPTSNNAGAATTGQAADPTTGAAQPAADPQKTTAAPTKAPTKKAAPPPAPTWKTVITLKGSGNKRSASFHLRGGQTRLKYKISGGDMLVAAIYVVEKGKILERDGGFPEVMPDGPGEDTTELAKDEGDYYLDVKAANCRWTVTIQEKR